MSALLADPVEIDALVPSPTNQHPIFTVSERWTMLQAITGLRIGLAQAEEGRR